MATAKIYLDTRTAKKDGSFPVKISINHQKKTSYYNTNVSVLPEQWNGVTQQVVQHPRRKFLNLYLGKTLADIQNCLYELTMHGEAASMSVADIKKYLLVHVAGQDIETEDGNGKPNIKTAFKEYMSKCKKQSTKEIYQYTLNKLAEYTNIDALTFEDINKSWLESFDTWMMKSCSMNTRSIHMRNIRTVFNDAIDNEITGNYPFRRFKIRNEETVKRSLSVDDLLKLRDYPCEPHQEQYRDMFMLIFYLVGINTIDLFNLKEKNIIDGRIVYRREKTGKLYSIKLEPEAAAIIAKYKGNNYLLHVLDQYGNYKDYRHRMNENLQSIGTWEYKDIKKSGKTYHIKERKPAFPQITTYWARHTWATIAFKLGISKDIISLALGHEYGCKTTGIYINPDVEEIDKANRKVLDYIKPKL